MTERADVRVVVVEDDASMARLLRHLLELDGYRSVENVWSGEQALAAADRAEIILLDQQLPDGRGLDLLPELLDRANPPSVVVITAHGNESLAATALRAGADDYLTKDHTLPELLPRIMERVRRNRALYQALREAEEDLIRSERQAAAGEMSVTLHHELNNPLMAALAEVDLALGDPALPEQHRTGLELAKTALLRMRDTIRRASELRRAQSTEYLGGVQMIDLEGGAAEDAEYRGRAVLQVADARAGRVLALLLRAAGFEVERSPSPADAQDAAAKVDVSLVVLTAGADLAAPLGGFTPAADRTYTLVVLGDEYAVRARAAGADLVLAMPFDPATVVSEILGDGREETSPG